MHPAGHLRDGRAHDSFHDPVYIQNLNCLTYVRYWKDNLGFRKLGASYFVQRCNAGSGEDLPPAGTGTLKIGVKMNEMSFMVYLVP
jgi:hypothetical protein